MEPFFRFLRFAGTFLGIIVAALSLFWVADASGLSAVAIQALGW